ncbi:excitatory amino acid transporter 3 [Exaiptasia diaphana]|uniref:Amino acid transporter n=1 Tax=Exaiptasia diaphana TaxID=2652724 RepID=A0A913Y8A8_EXADI|nr:excitatory amino acid transporter 3 [Exaiptasia diaphana]KXJ21974.1 Excitatory amino acid transporter 1 [Exaiptasia diaphana]
MARYSTIFEISNARWNVFIEKAGQYDSHYLMKTSFLDESMNKSEGKNSCSTFCSKCWHRIRSNFLLFLITVGVGFGLVIGIFLNGHVGRIKDQEEKATFLMLLGFPGEILMNMLKMLVLPLIIASLICALAALDSKASNRIARRAIAYYFTTTILAAVLGIVLVVSIRPGESQGDFKGRLKTTPMEYRSLDAFLDLIRSCFPSNIIAAMFSKKRTKYMEGEPIITTTNTTKDISKMNASHLSLLKIIFNGTHNISTVRNITQGSKTIPSGQMVDPDGGVNMLGVLIFSIVFGIVLGRTGDRGIPLKAIFESLNEVIIRMIGLVIWFSPVGICSLICVKIAGMADVMSSLTSLAMYMITVLTGLVVHAYIVLPIIFVIVTRKNPFRYILGIRDALVVAFGTASSTATLPVTISCLEDHNKVDCRISRFIVPLGAAINMDGTALYEAVAAVFIAQANGIELSIVQLIITCFTATAASIGAAGIPQAGMVTMVVVLQAVNLPIVDIGLVLTIDWFIDRIRTTVNVLGDSLGAGIVEHLSRDDLMNMDFIAREEIEPLTMTDDKFNPRDTGKRTASDSSIRETNF